MNAQPLHEENVFDLSIARPQASVVYITPEIAARWLEKNTSNRNISRREVAVYARDMASGNWKITGEAIKFAADGTLLDGQHRLHAVILSGATVAMFVVRGISRESQGAMDTGRKRSAADALTLAGEKYTTTIAAAARLAIDISRGGSGKGAVTHAEISEYLDAHPEMREAADIATRYARKTDIPPAVVAYAYTEMRRISVKDAVEFWMAASEKVGLQQHDAVIALTNRFAEARRGRETLSKPIMLSLIFRAWNYRRANKPTKLIRVKSPAGGVVPIPELR